MIITKSSSNSTTQFFKNTTDFKLIFKELSPVAAFYPNFKEWLYFTFRPSFLVGEREILVSHTRNEICGISLIKKSSLERKICTFYINPKYRNQGIAFDLMSKSVDFLGQDVLITVSEDRSYEFEPLLEKFDFICKEKINGLYEKNKIENHYRLV